MGKLRVGASAKRRPGVCVGIATLPLSVSTEPAPFASSCLLQILEGLFWSLDKALIATKGIKTQ
jgi:hypothetical protein